MFLNSLFLSLSHLFNAKALWNEKKHDAAELGVNTILYSLYTILYTIFSVNIERCLHAHRGTHHELSDSASHPPVPLRTAPTPHLHIFSLTLSGRSSWFCGVPWRRDGLSEASPTYPRCSYRCLHVPAFRSVVMAAAHMWSLSCPEQCSAGDGKWAARGRTRA